VAVMLSVGRSWNTSSEAKLAAGRERKCFKLRRETRSKVIPSMGMNVKKGSSRRLSSLDEEEMFGLRVNEM
jgi:hypothetical protein